MSVDKTYQTKNYEQQGGDTWVVGGTLEVVTGGAIVPDGGTAPSVAALTDNSGGTSGGDTIAVVTDNASAANAIATLAAKVNALQSALAALGVVA